MDLFVLLNIAEDDFKRIPSLNVVEIPGHYWRDYLYCGGHIQACGMLEKRSMWPASLLYEFGKNTLIKRLDKENDGYRFPLRDGQFLTVFARQFRDGQFFNDFLVY